MTGGLTRDVTGYGAYQGGSAVIRTTAVPNQEKEKNTLSREPREQFSMLILD